MVCNCATSLWLDLAGLGLFVVSVAGLLLNQLVLLLQPAGVLAIQLVLLLSLPGHVDHCVS